MPIPPLLWDAVVVTERCWMRSSDDSQAKPKGRGAEAPRPQQRLLLLRRFFFGGRTLDASQRSKLVDRLEKRGGPPGHRGGFRALREVARQLKLSDDQLDRIQAAVKESGGGMGERFSRMIKLHDQLDDAKKAFLGDRFNAADLEILKAVPGFVRSHIERAIRAAEKILPILSAEQRTAAAKLIEEHARGKGGWRH